MSQNKIIKTVLLKYVLIIIFLISTNILLNTKIQAQFINPIASVTGKVIDEKTELPVEVQLFLFDENDKLINSTKSVINEKGNYFLTGLKPGKKYYLAINQTEYINEKYEFDVPELDKYLEIKKDFLLKTFVKKETKTSKSTKKTKTTKKTKAKKATKEKPKG